MPPWGHFAPTVGQNAPSIVYIYFRFSQLQFFYYCKITLHVVQQNMKFRLTVLLCRKMHKCSRKLQKNVRGGVLPHPTLMLRTPTVTRRSPASSARRPRLAFALCRHGSGCNLGHGRGCPLVVHYLAYLQSGHGLCCYGNKARTLVTSRAAANE